MLTFKQFCDNHKARYKAANPHVKYNRVFSQADLLDGWLEYLKDSITSETVIRPAVIRSMEKILPARVEYWRVHRAEQMPARYRKAS